MEHFTDILFKRLEESEEYANFQRDFDALQKTIQNKSGLKDIYALVKTEAFPASMKKRTRLIIEEYLRDLLKDIRQDALELSCTHVSVSVSLPYEEVPSVEYKPFHWATPTTCLLTIDFASQKIKVYDASKEYKEAKRILEKNILEETEKLADMKDRLAVMKENQTSIIFILKEFYERLYLLRGLWFLKTFTPYVLFPSKRKDLRKIMRKLIQTEKERIKNQEEKIKRLEKQDYLQIYKKFKSSQKEVLEKVRVLGFPEEEVTVSSVFADANNEQKEV